MASLPPIVQAPAGRIGFEMSPGSTIEIDINSSPRELLRDFDHPAFLKLAAVILWLRQTNTTLRQLRNTPAKRVAYAAATWTFEVTP